DELAPGIYEVTVTDANACSVMNQFEIEENPQILVDITTTDITCFGDNTGTINIQVSGGLSPYTYNWSGPEGFTSTDENLTQLIAGDYTLQVSDVSGCIVDSTVTIVQPSSFEVTETVAAAGCSPFGNLGSIELFVTGGTPNYSISWTGPNGFSSSDFAMINLQPGVYNYTITDN